MQYFAILLVLIINISNICFADQKSIKALENAFISLKAKLNVIEQKLAGRTPVKIDIKNTNLYRSLQTLDINGADEWQLNNALKAYRDLEKGITSDEFTVKSMPSEIVGLKQQIENELDKRKPAQPQKTNINEDSNYKFLKKLPSDMSSISDAQLNQALTIYNQLETDIKKGKFTETTMPLDIVGLKQQIENELAVRQKKKEPKKMSKQEFQKLEEKVTEIYQQNKNANIEQLDLNVLKQWKADLEKWKKDRRRNKSHDMLYGRFLQEIVFAIRAIEGKKTPEQELQEKKNKLLSKIKSYKPTDVNWQMQSATVQQIDPMTGAILDSFEVHDYTNALFSLIIELNQYFKAVLDLNKEADATIKKFVEDTILNDLVTALDQKNYSNQLNDKQLRSYRELQEMQAISEKMNWFRFIRQAQQLFNYVNKPVPQSINNTYNKVIQDLQSGFKTILEEYNKESIWPTSKISISDIQGRARQYRDFLNDIGQDPVKDTILQTIETRLKS